MFKTYIILTVLLCYSLLASQEQISKKNQIGLYEHLGEKAPLHLTFTDDTNTTKTFKEYLNNTPTILTLNYFSCPSLCSPLLDGVAIVLDKMDLKPNIDYNVLTVSIDPSDNPKTAAKKKKSHLRLIKKEFPPQTWKFLTSDQKNIDLLTDAVGFKYETSINNNGMKEYLHPGAIIVLSPNGKITRYLNGVQFLPFDLKLALYEAKEERTGPTIAKTLLFCFAYDPKNKTYVFQAEKVIGTLMLLIVLGFFIYLIRTGRKNENDK